MGRRTGYLAPGYARPVTEVPALAGLLPKNLLQQQARFDDFIDGYNRERPHQAIDMRYPAELYVPSARPYRGVEDLEYPFHDYTAIITRCGRICHGNRKIT